MTGRHWDEDEIFFDFFKAALTGATVVTNGCTVEDVVEAAFEAAELATGVFIQRLNDGVQGDASSAEVGLQTT